jgi:type I restriction enzyme S subunit
MSVDAVPFQHPWNEVKLGLVAVVEVGGTPSTAVPAFWGGEIPWMASGDVHQRRIEDVPGRITELGLHSSNAKMIPPPAVAIALAGQGKTRGTVALTMIELCTNQSVALVRGHEGVLDSSYLFHSLDFRYEELRARSAGGGRAGLSKGLIEAIPLPLPPLPEQRRIAEMLDTVDAAIQQTEALIAKLKLMKAGLLHDLLTRGLDEQGHLRDPIAHPEQFKDSPLGHIPREWEINPLGSIAEIGSGVTLGRNLEDGPGNIELPYLRVANVQDGYLDLTEIKTVRIRKDELPRYLLQAGDVLMNEGGDFDKLGRGTVWEGQIAPCLHQNHVFRVRVDQQKLYPHFLAAVSSSTYGKRFFVLNSKQSTNLASINSTQLKAFPIPYPSLEEQKQILNALDAHDGRIRAEEACCDKLKQLKKGLMRDLLTGRVRVQAAEAAQ